MTFSLRQGLDDAEIKAHSVSSRVKSWDSIEEKTTRKSYDDPLEQMDDLVGARVVALFLSDLSRIEDLLGRMFDVLSSEDKVEGGPPEAFGYMSKHYTATLAADHSGPRYNHLRGLRFEIQVRTILMDAWANVSHYLAYKGEASIPAHLRRDFHALSGLFYVADQHFEIFFREALRTRKVADQELQDGAEDELNLETMLAFLQAKYPGRVAAEREAVSEFVEEVTVAGYDNLSSLEEKLAEADSVLPTFEERYPPLKKRGARYADVGAARNALAIADPEYRKKKYPKTTRFLSNLAETPEPGT